MAPVRPFSVPIGSITEEIAAPSAEVGVDGRVGDVAVAQLALDGGDASVPRHHVAHVVVKEVGVCAAAVLGAERARTAIMGFGEPTEQDLGLRDPGTLVFH